MAKKKITDVWTQNFAADEDIRAMVAQTILPKLRAVRDNRKALEDDWQRFYNMWSVIHDEGHGYNGLSKLYVPEVRKCIEAQARVFTDNAFPNDDFMTCKPGAGGTKRGADMQRAIRVWQIQNSQLKVKYHVFSRQQCMYGTSPAYVCWSERMEHAFKSMRDPKTGKIKPSRQLVEIYRGPDFMVRDLFHWYALNPNRNDLDRDGCVDYDILDRFDLVQKDRKGMLWGLDKILEGNSDAYAKEELWRDIARAETTGLLIQPNQGYAGSISLEKRDGEEDSNKGTYLLATVYARVQCAKACLEEEDPELGIPMKIEIYNDEHIGFVGRNPFFHQRPPYLVGRYMQPNPLQFYGQGIPQATQYMQYEINSKAEQAMDSVTYALNPVALIDPALAAQGAEFEIQPGAKWFVDPKGVHFAAMPDVSATGYNAISILKSQVQDHADRNPSLPSQLAGKARTATQAEIVNTVASVDVRAFQEQNEITILQPLMQMWESLTDQNVEEDQVIMLLGRNSQDWKRVVVSKNQTLGHYNYFWKVSRDLQNKQIQARQIIDSMKVVGSLPPEVQQQVKFNYKAVIRMLWEGIWNLPDADMVLGEPDGHQEQDPEVIFKMLEQGMEVEILPGDDDQKIIAFLDEKLKGLKDSSLKEEVMRQIALHAQQLEAKKQAMQQIQAQRQKQMMMVAEAQAKMQNKGGAQGSGNRSQLSPNASAGDMASGTRA